MLNWFLDGDDPVKKLGLLVLGLLVGTAVASRCLPA
jgi:hypothetical protein